MPKSKKEILIFARRLHNALRREIEDGDYRIDEDPMKNERSLYEHYSCSIYLFGCIAFLESNLGINSWNKPGLGSSDFDTFLATLPESKRKNLFDYGISKRGLDALMCIRNAITHNNSNISKNQDKDCLKKIIDANLKGVIIEKDSVRLISNINVDFMEYVRRSLIALTMYYDCFEK